MRVTIEREVQDLGFIRSKKAHSVKVSVVFSEEEKFAIGKLGIKNYIFFTKERNKYSAKNAPDDWLEVPVKDLLRPSVVLATCENELEANQEEVRIREALKTLKEVIEGNKASPKAKDSFEL